jgi:hypothetical protein
MIVKNPLNTDVSIVITGNSYTVSANGELSGITEEHALAWKKIHGFLIIKEEPVKTVTKEEKLPNKEEEPTIIKDKKK